MPHASHLLALFLTMLFAATGSSCSMAPSVDEVRNFLERAQTPVREALVLTFFPTGIGDAILVEFPNGSTMLVDAGVGWKASRITDYIAARRIGKIDAAVVTHPHSDHYGGFEEILDTVHVDRFFDNGVVARSFGLESMNAAVDALAIPRGSLSRGDALTELSGGTVVVDTLYPDAKARETVDRPFGDENDASIVLRLVHGPHRILLVGDAEREEELRLMELEGEALRAHVLKLGHHASTGSSTKAFLAEVQPRLAIAQGTELVDIPLVYPRPCYLLLQRLRDLGTEFADTEQDGLVQVVSDNDGLRWTTWELEGEWKSIEVANEDDLAQRRRPRP